MKNKLSNKLFNIFGLIFAVLAIVFMLTRGDSSNFSMIHDAIHYTKPAPLVGFVILVIITLFGIGVTLLSILEKPNKFGWIVSVLLAAIFIYFLLMVLLDKDNSYFNSGLLDSPSKCLMCVGISAVCYGVGVLI